MYASQFFGPATAWALAAAVPAVLCEYLFRKLPGPWHHYLYVFIPCALFINYAVCQLIRQPGLSLLDALIVWTLSIMVLRVFATYMLGDAVAAGTWFALALIVMARIVQVGWR